MRKRLKHRSICPVASTLDLIGDKWSLLVVRDLAQGLSRFNELSRSPEKIASNILADRLQKLTAYGLVDRFDPGDSSGRDAYRLTERGRSLLPILQTIARWGLEHIDGTQARLAPESGI